MIALPHPALLELSRETGHPLTDPWCMRLAGRHLIYMIESGEDLEKTLVTVPLPSLASSGRRFASGLTNYRAWYNKILEYEFFRARDSSVNDSGRRAQQRRLEKEIRKMVNCPLCQAVIADVDEEELDEGDALDL